MTVSSPSSAATRSASPDNPVPPRTSAPPAPSSDTSTVRRALGGADPHGRGARARVLGHVRQRLGDDEVDARLDRVREPLLRHLEHATGSGIRDASRATAGPSPRCVRIAGWMPAASSRSSLVAPAASSIASSSSRAASSGSDGSLPRAIRSRSARLTSCCWAPSCRSRSSRARAASAASMMRRRASAQLARAGARDVALARGLLGAQVLLHVGERGHRAGPVGQVERRRRERDPEDRAVLAHEPVLAVRQRLARSAARA